MLERLFEPFTQAPQTMDRARGGLGLGLNMVKGLVELHGGRVRMTSDGAGHGCTLTLTLPEAAPPARGVLRREAQVATPRRIFVVEDNADAADTLCHALSLLGHRVEAAYDGLSAAEQARAFRPEIVLCDIGLPGMDGYGVARAFRADPVLRTSYLIALSGYALPEDLERAANAGFDCHVAKPPSMQQLSQIIASAPRASSGLDAQPGA